MCHAKHSWGVRAFQNANGDDKNPVLNENVFLPADCRLAHTPCRLYADIEVIFSFTVEKFEVNQASD